MSSFQQTIGISRHILGGTISLTAKPLRNLFPSSMPHPAPANVTQPPPSLADTFYCLDPTASALGGRSKWVDLFIQRESWITLQPLSSRARPEFLNIPALQGAPHVTPHYPQNVGLIALPNELWFFTKSLHNSHCPQCKCEVHSPKLLLDDISQMQSASLQETYLKVFFAANLNAMIQTYSIGWVTFDDLLIKFVNRNSNNQKKVFPPPGLVNG